MTRFLRMTDFSIFPHSFHKIFVPLCWWDQPQWLFLCSQNNFSLSQQPPADTISKVLFQENFQQTSKTRLSGGALWWRECQWPLFCPPHDVRSGGSVQKQGAQTEVAWSFSSLFIVSKRQVPHRSFSCWHLKCNGFPGNFSHRVNLTKLRIGFRLWEFQVQSQKITLKKEFPATRPAAGDKMQQSIKGHGNFRKQYQECSCHRLHAAVNNDLFTANFTSRVKIKIALFKSSVLFWNDSDWKNWFLACINCCFATNRTLHFAQVKKYIQVRS